jgi:hypothetical protein
VSSKADIKELCSILVFLTSLSDLTGLNYLFVLLLRKPSKNKLLFLSLSLLKYVFIAALKDPPICGIGVGPTEELVRPYANTGGLREFALLDIC